MHSGSGMLSDLEVIAIHGWAFDRNCWKGWRDLLPANTDFSCYDRGYFSHPFSTGFNGNRRRRILLLHSFGLHICDRELLESADLVAVFGGFRMFHPVTAQFRRRSRLILQRMKQKLPEQPDVVLNEFWRNTYYPVEPPRIDHVNQNVGLLLEDLELLGRSELDIKCIGIAKKFCILHGSKDRIVPKAKGRELFNLLYDRASYLEVKNAGHALPMTHSDQCWSFIKTNI